MRRAAAVLVTIAILALVFAPLTARAEGEAEGAPMSEAAFIEMAGAPKPGDDAGGESGRPIERVPAGKAKEEEQGTEGDAEDPDSGDGEGAGGGSDDDDPDGEGEGEGEGDDDEDPDGEADPDGGSDDAPAKGKKKGKDGAAGDEDPDREGDPDGGSDADDAAFQAALEAEGVEIALETLPKAARPVVEKMIHDLKAGFTRATTRLAEERKSAAQFRAEERFRKERPADFIVAMLLEDPKVSEQVNAIIGDMEGNATAASGHKAVVEKARRDAAEAEGKADREAKARDARIDRYITLGRAAAKASNVPFEAGVEEAIAAHILIHGEISEAEIRGIARAKAKVLRGVVRQEQRTRSKEQVTNKVQDRRTAGLKVKPGTGSAPAPGARKMPKNDQEFIEQYAGQSA